MGLPSARAEQGCPEHAEAGHGEHEPQGLGELADPVSLSTNLGTENETCEPCRNEATASEGNSQAVRSSGDCMCADLKPLVRDPLSVVGVDYRPSAEPTKTIPIAAATRIS